MIPQCGPTFLLSFRPSDFDRTTMMPPRVTPRCTNFAIHPMRPMFHLRNQRLHLVHVILMMIRWTPVHTIDARHSTRSHPWPAKLPRVLRIEKIRGTLSHTEEIGKTGKYKLWGCVTHLRYRPNSLTRAH